MRILANLFLVIFIILSFSTKASALTIQELKADCEDNQIVKQMFCTGYIAGTSVQASADSQNTNRPIPKKCLRFDLTNGQLQDVFLNWARNNPKYYQEPASSGVVTSYVEAFCGP